MNVTNTTQRPKQNQSKTILFVVTFIAKYLVRFQRISSANIFVVINNSDAILSAVIFDTELNISPPFF